MQNDEQDLQAIWQQIDTTSKVDVEEIFAKAEQQKRIGFRWLIGDIIGNLICIAVVILFYIKGFSLPALLVMAGITLYCFYFTYRSYRLRLGGLQHLTDSTHDYKQYLTERATALIKLGKFFIHANLWVCLGVVAFFVTESVYGNKPLTFETWRIVVGGLWIVVCLTFIYYYGRKQIRKGTQILANLEDD